MSKTVTRERERETTAPASCKIHFMSIIKTNGIVLFGEIAGVYSENHRKETNILYGKMYVTASCMYTGCPRRNVPDFGRVFLMLKYTDITQNTYVQS